MQATGYVNCGSQLAKVHPCRQRTLLPFHTLWDMHSTAVYDVVIYFRLLCAFHSCHFLYSRVGTIGRPHHNHMDPDVVNYMPYVF